MQHSQTPPGDAARRVVILTALPVEYQAVRAHLTGVAEETHRRGTVYNRGTFVTSNGNWEVGLVEIGAGNANAAVECERAIEHFDPPIVLFVGVAGGIKDVALGDVVAATKIYGYESGKARTDFEPRPEAGQSAYDLVQRARAEARKADWLRRLPSDPPDPPPRVVVGPIAAGDKVIASTQAALYTFLRSQYGDALAVEMEGCGFLRAAYANHQVHALVVRGISDLIDGKAEADVAGSQERAARHASGFAFEVLAKLLSNVSAPPGAVGDVHQGSSDRGVSGTTTSDRPLSLQIQARMEQARRELAAEQARTPRQRTVTLSETLQAERDGTTLDLSPAPTFQEEMEERRRQALAARDAEQAARKAVDDALQAHADKLMAPLILKVEIDQTIDAAELERSLQGVAEGRFPWWSLTENTSATDGDIGRAYRRITLHYDMGAGVERDDERIYVADVADVADNSGPYEPVRTWRRFA